MIWVFKKFKKYIDIINKGSYMSMRIYIKGIGKKIPKFISYWNLIIGII